jgi:hypothetical protein
MQPAGLRRRRRSRRHCRAARGGHAALGPALDRRVGVAPLRACGTPIRASTSSGSGWRPRRRPHSPFLDDLPSGAAARRPGAQGRARHRRDLLPSLSAEEAEETRKRGPAPPRPQELHRIQRLPDRRGCRSGSSPSRGRSRPDERDAPSTLLRSDPARIRHGGSRGLLLSACDQVTMPEPGLFSDLDHYRATLAHELSHWTGTRAGSRARWAAGSAARPTRWRSWWRSFPPRCSARSLGLPVAHLDHHAS